MSIFTIPNIFITPYCEQQDFIGILNIISENPRLKYLQETQEQRTISHTAIPPLNIFLKHKQTTCRFKQLKLEIINSSHTHVLRLQGKIIGFIRFSLTSKKPFNETKNKASGNIIAIALAQTFERSEYQEELIRHAMRILLREYQVYQIDAEVRAGNESLHDTYTRLAFSYNREDSSKGCSVYTFIPTYIR